MHQYMNLCPSVFLFQFDALCIITWNHGCPCVPLCDYSSNPTFSPTTWLECVHASVHVLLSSDSPYLLHPICILTWKDVFLCVAWCVFQSLYLWSHILDRRCTCSSICTSVYLTPNVFFTPFAYLHGKMGSSVWHCVCHPVIYFWSHTLFKMCTCISTLIYVHTWLCTSVPPHLNSFMKTWVPLCDIVCLSQSAYFYSHTFVRMCTCISIWVYVHLTPQITSNPYA